MANTSLDARTIRIRELNDACRMDISSYIFTRGVVDTFESMNVPLLTLVFKVARYNAFNEDNDPYGEHDFGVINTMGETIYWKIDYYNLAKTAHSDDPADETITRRILSVLLADEY